MLCLGIDWGEKRIGLAIGNTEIKIATPIKIVSSAADVLSLIKIEGIEQVVLGKPMPIHGHHTEVTMSGWDNFLAAIKEATDHEVIFIDERHSSKAADALSGGRNKETRDAVAAMVILQTYFDKL